MDVLTPPQLSRIIEHVAFYRRLLEVGTWEHRVRQILDILLEHQGLS
jgi:hypothetical protein